MKMRIGYFAAALVLASVDAIALESLTEDADYVSDYQATTQKVNQAIQDTVNLDSEVIFSFDFQ